MGLVCSGATRLPIVATARGCAAPRLAALLGSAALGAAAGTCRAPRFVACRSRPLLAFGRALALAGRRERMTVRIPATHQQTAAEGVGRRRGPDGSPTRDAAPTPNPGSVHAVAFGCAKAGRQCTVMRERLALAHTPALVIVFLEQTQLHHDCLRHRGVKLFPTPATQVAGQHDLAKTRADQAADGNAGRFEHATHLAVTAFVKRNAIPAVAAFAAQVLQRAEACLAVIERNAGDEALLLLSVELTQH